MSSLDSQARPIFIAALERGSNEWQAFLEDVCRDDSKLKTRVDQLLQAHMALGSVRRGGTETRGDTREFVCTVRGTQIGPYKLLELIGEGGMGAVYLAQQIEPVKRLVALKVIKAGMDSSHLLARFEAESQALALMDHPNIARVLDAGYTGAGRQQSGDRKQQDSTHFELSPDCRLLSPDPGRPYIVMELVKGVPITKFCDERKLTLRERLELFVPVCHAIQHAHQKGIIHRDIKPSNVMVALYDGKPVPKVIDFGVAKAAGQPLTERTLVTGLGALVGTPEYMSPEQAELNQLDIDTRSDIYSLGVVLYELLTGTTPLTHKRLKESALLDVLRAIREEEPPKPSTRISSIHELPAIAANRRIEPARLERLVHGEIDWIVMKALEKDRCRRYETANCLAADVERYLAGGTVQAVPPSVGYRLRKFARRNKRALVSAAVLGFMLLVLVGGLGWVVSDRSARQARTAFEVKQFIHRAESLYTANRLPEAVGELEKARGVLTTTGGGDEDLRRLVRQRLIDLETATALEEVRSEVTESAARDRIYAEYARLFREYGIDLEVLSTEEAAARIAASHIKLDLVLALERWASKLRSDGRQLDSTSWQRKLAIARASDPDPWLMRYNAAHEARDLKALKEIAEGTDPKQLRTRLLAALGDSLREMGDVQSSTDFLRKVQRLYPDDYSINASLAWSLRSLKPPQWHEAVAFRRAAVALRPDSSIAHLNLGFSLHQLKKLDDAVECYRKAIELEPRNAPAHMDLAIVLREQGKPAEAIRYFQKTVDLLPTDPNPLNALTWELITSADPKLRDYPRGWELAKRVVELSIGQRDDRDAEGRDRLANYYNTLGVAHYRVDRLKEALAALEKSLEISPKGHCRTTKASCRYLCEDYFFLAMVTWKLGRKDEARKWYDQAVAWVKNQAPEDKELDRFRVEAETVMQIEEKE